MPSYALAKLPCMSSKAGARVLCVMCRKTGAAVADRLVVWLD